jgi:hypothetical protein
VAGLAALSLLHLSECFSVTTEGMRAMATSLRRSPTMRVLAHLRVKGGALEVLVRKTKNRTDSLPPLVWAMSDAVWERMFQQAAGAGTKVDDEAAAEVSEDESKATAAALRTQQVKEGSRHASALRDWITDPLPTASAMERFARISSERPVRPNAPNPKPPCSWLRQQGRRLVCKLICSSELVRSRSLRILYLILNPQRGRMLGK